MNSKAIEDIGMSVVQNFFEGRLTKDEFIHHYLKCFGEDKVFQTYIAVKNEKEDVDTPSLSSSLQKKPFVCVHETEEHTDESVFYVCDGASWLKLRNLIFFLLDGINNSGKASMVLYVFEESTNFLFDLTHKFPTFNSESLTGAHRIWFQLPKVYAQIVDFVALQRMNLHKDTILCVKLTTRHKWSAPPKFCNQSPQMKINVIFQEESLLVTLKMMCINETSKILEASRSIIEIRYTGCQSRDMTYRDVSTPAVVSDDLMNEEQLCVFGCPVALPPVNNAGDIINVEDSCQVSLDLDIVSAEEEFLHFSTEIEIDEMILKSEASETEEVSESCGTYHASNRRNIIGGARKPVKKNRADANDVVGFLRTYVRQYHRMGQLCLSQSTLLVECPQCDVTFKGSEDRLLRLVLHVKKQHKNKERSIIKKIKRTYENILDEMKWRMGNK